MNASFFPLTVRLFGLLWLANAAQAQVNVLTYHNDFARTGQNTNETTLTLANVQSATFGKLFSYSVDGYVFAQPLIVAGVTIPGQGVRNLLFIATEHNTVYAFDADSNAGAGNGLIWKTNLGPSAVTPNADFGRRYNNNMYIDIVPEVGITGTPVIDLATGTLYVDAFTHDGSVYNHRLHALNITNGYERAFSPKLVSASFPGGGVGSQAGVVPLTAIQHLQRSALTLAGGILYVCYTGYADTNPYHGWVVGFDPSTLTQLPGYVFNTTPNSTIAAFGANAGEGGIWMGGNGLAVDAGTNLYFEIGNGIFTATNNSGGTEYGDTFMKLSTSNGLSVADYFTPWNQASLALNDTDLGSGGLMLLPDQPGNFPHLLVGAGKEGKIYLINRDQMTTGNNHYNATTSVDSVVQTLVGKITRSFSTPSYFNNRIYYAGSGDVVKAFSLSNGLLSSSAVSSGTRTFGFPGATTSISANGTSNGIVWALQNASPAVLAAYNATNLLSEIYNSGLAGTRDRLTNGVKFALPTVANGKVYAGGQYSVAVFGLFPGNASFLATSFSANEAAGTATISVRRTGGSYGAAQVTYATVAGGTATEGVDYSAASGTLSWADGDATTKSFTVTILDDDLAEPNETVNLALSAPSGINLGAPTNTILTILEDPAEAWRYAHFGTNANNASIAGDQADADGDGIVNLLEYGLGSDPNTQDSVHSPTIAISAGHAQLYFHRNTSASDLTFTLEYSDSLSTWTPIITYTTAAGWVPNVAGVAAAESAPSGVPPDEFVNVTIDIAGPLTTQFLRLSVHR